VKIRLPVTSSCAYVGVPAEQSIAAGLVMSALQR